MYWVYNILRHDHWVLFLLHIQLNLCLSLEMINHYISYIFLNKRTFHKNVAFLFVEITTIGCRCGFLIYSLIKSIPYPLSGYQYTLPTLPNLGFIFLKTLALIVGFILVLIIIIGGVLHSALICILDWYITFVVKTCSIKYFV